MSVTLVEELQLITRERLRRCRQSLLSIEKRAQELRAEVTEAERTMEILGSLHPQASKQPKTKTATILTVLANNPSGLSKGELLAELKALSDEVNPKSLDTLLWRLKRDLKIEGGAGSEYRLTA